MWEPRDAAEVRAADEAVTFISHLRHSKGQWAGAQFTPLPWQANEVIKPLFGTLRGDGLRQYRTAYVEVPRKSGKTQIAAAIALKLLFADGEAEGEVYAAASDRDQASLVFNAAAQMVRTSSKLSKMAKVVEHTKRIVVTRGPCIGSVLRAIPADAAGAHGFNASGVVADELHVWPNRDLWDVLATSQGARQQPLMLGITTAGYDRNSLCWELHEYARQVRDGLVEDESFLPVLYSADEKDDWLDRDVWMKANPSLGVTVPVEFLEREARKAEAIPAYENTFRRLYLNQWTAQQSRFMPMREWDACTGQVDERALQGRTCYAGLDLSSTTDLTALALVFPPDHDGGTYQAMMRFWTPEERLEDRGRRDRVPYRTWAQQDLIEATEGNVVDYAAVEREVQKLSLKYRIPQLAVDRLFNAEYLAQRLDDAGLEIKRKGQGFLDMSFPTKELLRLVLQRRLAHGGNPVLRWHADNVMVEQDAAGNIKPSKAKSTQRIDGIVALILALNLAMEHVDYDVAASVF